MTYRGLLWLAVAFASLAIAATADAATRGEDPSPLVIGHRGTSGHLPEHTLAGYALAIRLGADYIEPDLVATQDGHLIARHEPNITNTTDVKNHPEFAARKRTATIDGAQETGWFASDFTLAQIKTLRAVQPFAERAQRFNGRYKIPTFREVITLAKRWSKRTGRAIGIDPETKHPTYHKSLGLALEPRLLAALKRAGWNKATSPVFIQSFERATSKAQPQDRRAARAAHRRQRHRPRRHARLHGTVRPTIRLDGHGTDRPVRRPDHRRGPSRDRNLRRRHRTVEAVHRHSEHVDLNGDGTVGDENGDGVTNDADRRLLGPTDLVARAHAHGLLVHPYTFRNEPRRLASDYAGNPISEYLQFYALGVDGVFSDFVDTAFAARELFWMLTGVTPNEDE